MLGRRELSIAGNIISVIMSEGSVVVMSAPGLAPLDEDTVLCCTKADKDGKHDASCVIGCISEVFGPVRRVLVQAVHMTYVYIENIPTCVSS